MFNLSLGTSLDSILSCSCGDDGRIRGWKWKEFSSPNYSVSSQGDNACLGMVHCFLCFPLIYIVSASMNLMVCLVEKKELCEK